MLVEPWSAEQLPEAVRDLLRNVLCELGEAEDELAMSLDQSASDTGLTFTASDSGRPVGVLIATPEPWNRAAFVRWIAVAPEARRMGVGTALVEALVATPWLESITGMVDQTDPAALAFWQGQGWSVRKPRPGRRRELMGVELAAVRPEAA